MVTHQVSVPTAIKAECINDNSTSENYNYNQDYMVVDKQGDKKKKRKTWKKS